MTEVATESAPADEVVVECDLDAAPEAVWRTLTVPALAEEWMGAGSRGDGERPDGRSCTILDTVPGSRVRYAWNDGEADPARTLVTIDISPAPQGRTHFRLTHGPMAGALPRAANANRPPTLARAA